MVLIVTVKISVSCFFGFWKIREQKPSEQELIPLCISCEVGLILGTPGSSKLTTSGSQYSS
uniref:Uncharacterized protein n=1 Tax=Aegilops tauschii subsp. strangulata TaxID=200361 RepID=A0A453FB64_AEGTS